MRGVTAAVGEGEALKAAGFRDWLAGYPDGLLPSPLLLLPVRRASRAQLQKG